ncbi:MAG: hypothetical protein ABI761_06330, partial [Saprospiraceae bacterium]
EVLDVSSGKTKMILETMDWIGSPSFTKDGKNIQYDNGNKSFLIPVSGGKPKETISPVNSTMTESDGMYTYYSDQNTGTNQVWRKKQDGIGQQLTYDSEHAWYPHLSPDKKYIAYLAYPHDVNPKQSVAYQKVSLKLLPLGGGGAKNIAYFFGGKGSFEKNSWSPDGKQIVYISNGMRR